MPIQPGSRLGGYEVQDLLGQGAMGSVYRAYHAALARTAAVKVLQALAPDPDARARFEREAQSIARLRHPNIVTVFDFGELDGTPYMVVEFVAGGSLADRLKRQPAPTREEALILLTGIAAALDQAHALGIVHRDVKPANVLLDADGRPVLADFGLAKLLQHASQQTATGMTTGTPAYMAPEQVMGTAVGPAADVYALATLAYQLVTGRLPFEGESVMELLYAHVHKHPPPPSTVNAALPKAVDEVLLRGLAKAPDERWPTCGALVSALAAALDAKPESPPLLVAPAAAATVIQASAPQKPRGRGRYIAAGAAVLVLFLLAAGLAAVIHFRNESGRSPRAAGHPSVHVDTTNLRTGGKVEIVGSGYSPGRAFASLVAAGRGSTLVVNDIAVGSGGAFDVSATVPAVAAGSYSLRVCNMPAPGSNCTETPVTVAR